MDIVLASGSPRRKELLRLLVNDFKIVPADVEEKADTSLPMGEMAESLAKLKADAVFKDFPDTLVIGSDTIVFLDGRPLGKPKDEEDAFNTLKALQGRSHSVVTGVALVGKGFADTFHTKTEVTFYPMTDEEIKWYINTKEPMDKAGSYGINGHGSLFIEKIEGDFYSVVGLPVAELKKHMEFCGFTCLI